MPTAAEWDARLKRRVQDAGGLSLDKFEEMMNQLDTSGDGQLDREEFYSGLRKMGLDLTKLDSDVYFDAVCKKFGTKGVTINVAKYVTSLVPPLNKTRKRLVKKAYKQMDANGDGKVSVEELKHSSCVRSLPHVKDGSVSEVDEMEGLIGALQGKDLLDFDSFRAYVEHRVSLFVVDDDDFGEIIAAVWSVPFIPAHMRAKAIEIVRERIVHNKGERDAKRETKHVFKKMDKDKSGELSLDEFRAAMKSMSVWLSDPMVHGLFEHYDEDGSGFVSYEEFVDGVFPDGV